MSDAPSTVLDRTPARFSPRAEATSKLTRVEDGDGEREEREYQPPESPDQDTALWLGLKMACAMLLANFIALRLGFESPTWSVLTAAFLATSPPIASGKAALKKLVALAVGIVLGVAGALAADTLSSVALLHLGVVGLVAGALGSRSPDYLFAAVVGTVVTFVGSAGGDPTMEVATRTVCMVLIGCAVGPAVVWVIERVRERLFKAGWIDG